MKKVIIGIFLCCLFIPMTVTATGTEETEEVTQEEVQDEWLEQYDFSDIDKLLEDIFPKEKLTLRKMITELVSGETELSFELVKQLVSDRFFYEIESNRSGLIHMLLLVIVAAIFANFSGVFQGTQVSEISFYVLYMLLISICLNNFRILVEATAANLQQLTDFMKLLGPVYFLAVAFATGSSTSIAFYQLVLLIIYLVELLIQSFLIPLVQIYLIVRILGGLSPEIHLTKFAELIETIVSWSLKTLLAGVIGFNVIQRLLAPAIDSVKRSILTKGSGAIPIIGDAISGTAEVVLGTAVLIKNGIGVAGMVVCLVVCMTPLIQMAVTTLMYKLVAALIQPISDKRMVECVSAIADGANMLLKIVFTTGVLFLITIAIVATTRGG